MIEYDGRKVSREKLVCAHCGSLEYGKLHNTWVCHDCNAAADTRRGMTTTVWEWLRALESDWRDDDGAT